MKLGGELLVLASAQGLLDEPARFLARATTEALRFDDGLAVGLHEDLDGR